MLICRRHRAAGLRASRLTTTWFSVTACNQEILVINAGHVCNELDRHRAFQRPLSAA